MNAVSKFAAGAWLVVLLGAGIFLIWINHARMERVDYVTGLAQPARHFARVEAASPTGYAPALRELIVP